LAAIALVFAAATGLGSRIVAPGWVAWAGGVVLSLALAAAIAFVAGLARRAPGRDRTGARDRGSSPATKPVLRHRDAAGLPRLAWLATTSREAGDVLVYHGPAVERTPEWMVEGVWDDEFRLGAFHRSAHFFGSGIRVEDGHVHFVPSSALVNRLLYCIHHDRVLVSRTLALLLAYTGATLDPEHDYRAETYAI